MRVWSSRRGNRAKQVRGGVLRVEALEAREVPSGTPVWGSFGHDDHHTGLAVVASQSLDVIRWQTPVDVTLSGTHVGSPLITANNTVVVTVKTGSGAFRVEGHRGSDGSLLWTQSTDYVLPPDGNEYFSAVLTPTNRLYYPGAGGTVYYCDNPDQPGATKTGQLAFYGIANYDHSLDSKVYIKTPLTADNAGNIYFGFAVSGSTSLNLRSGIARMTPGGSGAWIGGARIAGTPAINTTANNAAPALSNDESTIYVVAVSSSSSKAVLAALDSSTLKPKARVTLHDPLAGGDPDVYPESSATPMVGPDGDVYFGVLENPYPENNDRGWMLHFSADLTQTKTPGAFGWDDTGSVVPRTMVPSYTGSSAYLLMTKYNNYAGIGSGDGVNKIAVLDPNATMTDPVTGATVMKEVLTIKGVTPDPYYVQHGYPNAVREWCINAAAVDPFTKSVLANSEDGSLYRWDLTTNTFTQSIKLTSGVGEAYTPTAVGADGTVYAINRGVLFAVQAAAAGPGALRAAAGLSLAHAARLVPSASTLTPEPAPAGGTPDMGVAVRLTEPAGGGATGRAAAGLVHGPGQTAGTAAPPMPGADEALANRSVFDAF
jgi:hypothetical protein